MNKAFVYLIIATSFFSIINVGVKFLSHLPASEIVVFRGGVSLLICSFFLWNKKVNFLGKNKRILILRGFFGTISVLTFFICIQNMPLAVALTLINLSPLFTVIIAHFVLNEKANILQWFFLMGSFLGVFLVRGEVTPVPIYWILLGLFSAFSAGIAYTCVRHLRLTENPLVVIFYFSLMTIPMIGPVMLYQWQTPVGFEWLILIGLGVLTQGAQYFMTLAYQMETAANVMIFNYSGLFWGILLGWVLFNETLSSLQVMGVLLVFLCLCGNYFSANKKRMIRV